ncbi:hypothetical protein AB0G04_37855 [Actinoplanes sp. NPDC023801]|uniref:hypothetical protein n=1 Tax=Actinoplanes sp. NPDC023801 TaxID=3154595 RepID=UPI0033EF344B
MGTGEGMRRFLGDGWSIELPATWTPERTTDGVCVWRAPGRTGRVSPGDLWRCADGAGTGDPGWAFDAWRSVARSAVGDQPDQGRS